MLSLFVRLVSPFEYVTTAHTHEKQSLPPRRRRDICAQQREVYQCKAGLDVLCLKYVCLEFKARRRFFPVINVLQSHNREQRAQVFLLLISSRLLL